MGRHDFDVAKLSGIEGMPLVYWWDSKFIDEYVRSPKLSETYEVRKGVVTGDDVRFVRVLHELRPQLGSNQPWAPFIMGAKGAEWFEPCRFVINWRNNAMEIAAFAEVSVSVRLRDPGVHFRGGIAFSQIGNTFRCRAHRVASVIGNKGSSVLVHKALVPSVLLCLNKAQVRAAMSALNPGIGFELSDVKRVPLLVPANCEAIFSRLETAFSEHETRREASPEFKCPGRSPWRYAQAWTQYAIDHAEEGPLPAYDPEYDVCEPVAYLSFAIGIALGRFGANGEGILTEPPATALPAGILYLTGSETLPDSLSHPAAAGIATAWAEHSSAILDGDRRDLRDWLRDKFFPYHKTLYENRPIYFPLSSAKKNFVAFISIHRWTDTTLQTLLADHLYPNLRQLEAAIADLNQARASSDRKTASGADRQYTQIKRLRDELADFITAVSECAERGAPPAPGGPPRDADAPFHMDLDDGVMINSAALWPLLEPQWKDPKKWWKELCEAKGRKDYDWAHLAARYFPKRVDEKCRVDPSLAVAHGCFWKYHPAKAYAWELRLAYEIGPDFAIDEKDAAEHRVRFLADHAEQANEILQKERDRRERLRRREADTDAEPPRPGLSKTRGSEPPESDIVDSDEQPDEQVAV